MHFKHFLVAFERQFKYRIHVLHTDGGGEYKALDLFSKEAGVCRQVGERDNQASQGKAERMRIHYGTKHDIFKWVDLTFWG